MLSHERPIRALVVDDDPHVMEFISDVLQDAGVRVSTARDGDDALAVAESFRPDIVFLDIVMPQQDGWLVCTKIKLQSSPVIVLITGFPEDSSDRFADFVHADALLRKPFSEEDLLRTLENFVAVG